MKHHPTQFVSIPRSGHHWLQRSLSMNLGEEWRYDEWYGSGNSPGLIIGATCDAQKSHDLECETPIPKEPPTVTGLRYVVQVRFDIDATLKSWTKIGPDSPNHRSDAWKLRYMLQFMLKWVAGTHGRRDVLVIPYESIITSPRIIVYRVLKFITYDKDWHIDEVKFEQSTKQLDNSELLALVRASCLSMYEGGDGI